MAEEKTTPAMYDHLLKVFSRMKTEAVQEENALVWEGFATRLILTEMQIPTPYYSYILKTLKEMGCVMQERRGGSTTPSRWAILGDPTPELYTAALDRMKAKVNPLAERMDVLEQRMTEVVHLFGGLDIRKALFDLQAQINSLQEKVNGTRGATVA